jgi:hypothetical protein
LRNLTDIYEKKKIMSKAKKRLQLLTLGTLIRFKLMLLPE